MKFTDNSVIDLERILEKHKKWLNGEEGGEMAVLSGVNLCGVDFRDVNLRGANLCNANLYRADLRGAYLNNANLFRADLREADLNNTNLCYADLCEANLCDANLFRADLRGACLNTANLYHANFRGAIIEDDTLNSVWPICCPESGSFIGWKKAKDKIIKLEICEDALRSSAFGRKCRCSKAKVISIENINGGIFNFPAVTSDYDEKFIYIVGQTVEVKDFDTDRKNECAAGIHFFMTREEAVEYHFR